MSEKAEVPKSGEVQSAAVALISQDGNFDARWAANHLHIWLLLGSIANLQYVYNKSGE